MRVYKHHRCLKRVWADACAEACANQCLQAASTIVPALNTPSPIRLEARRNGLAPGAWPAGTCHRRRSEEHTSELQSLMRISYAVFCLKKKKCQDSLRHESATVSK